LQGRDCRSDRPFVEGEGEGEGEVEMRWSREGRIEIRAGTAFLDIALAGLPQRLSGCSVLNSGPHRKSKKHQHHLSETCKEGHRVGVV
jgi:hypothetical protein